MSNNQFLAIEATLRRYHIAEPIIERFKSRRIDRISSLRSLDTNQLREICQDDQAAEVISNFLNRVGVEQGPKQGPAAVGAGGGGGNRAYPEDDNRGDNSRRARGGKSRGGGNNSSGMEGDFSHGKNTNRGRGPKNPVDQQIEPHEGENRGLNLSKNNETEVTIPVDNLKFLLASSAERLIKIHQKYQTSNSKIEKDVILKNITDRNIYTTFIVYGPTKEAVENAKKEILYVTGIYKENKQNARFKYELNELEHNVSTVKILAVANHRAKDTNCHLSEPVLKRVIETFRFQLPENITHFSTTGGITIRDKLEFLSTNCLCFLKGVQVIIFTEEATVVKMKSSGRSKMTLGVNHVSFVHPQMPKEERMKELEEFKKGENKDNIINRVLITTKEYAVLAKKVEIPYVNMIVHFTLPKTKEIYMHQAKCCGRNGKTGISLLFYQSFDSRIEQEYSSSFQFKDYTRPDFETAAARLEYDTVDHPLSSANAEPLDNWRETMEQEKIEKETKKAQKKKAQQ